MYAQQVHSLRLGYVFTLELAGANLRAYDWTILKGVSIQSQAELVYAKAYESQHILSHS